MTTEHEFEVPKSELDIPSSLYLSPEKLMALEEKSHGEPLTWGATPLEPHRKDIIAQQNEVQREIRELFPKKADEVPYGLNLDTAHYIHDNYDMRTTHRVSRNYESFQYRGKFDISDVPIEALGFIDRSLSGHASPAEILATAQLLQIPTVELASLSHPYGGKRLKKHLKPMRAAVNEGVRFFGGTLAHSEPEYEVRHATYFNDAEYSSAEPSLLMTRTITIGEIGVDTRIIERSSFVAILPRLAPHLVEKVQAIDYDRTWSEQIMQIPGFKKAIERSLKNDRYDISVPISTTSVAINSQLEKELTTNKEHVRERQRQVTRRAMLSAGKFFLLEPK